MQLYASCVSITVNDGSMRIVLLNKYREKI